MLELSHIGLLMQILRISTGAHANELQQAKFQISASKFQSSKLGACMTFQSVIDPCESSMFQAKQ